MYIRITACFPTWKVCDNISYGLKMHGFSKEEQRKRTSDLMEMLSITHIKNQYPGTLSGGESQRTALAGRWRWSRKFFC